MRVLTRWFPGERRAIFSAALGLLACAACCTLPIVTGPLGVSDAPTR